MLVAVVNETLISNETQTNFVSHLFRFELFKIKIEITKKICCIKRQRKWKNGKILLKKKKN